MVTYTDISQDDLIAINTETIRAKTREYYWRNPEKRREYCRWYDHLPRVKEHRRFYELARKESKKEYRHQYYLAHRELEISRATEYNKVHREKHAEYNRICRSKRVAQ